MAKNKPFIIARTYYAFLSCFRPLIGTISWKMNTSHNVPHGLGDLVGIPVRRLEDDELLLVVLDFLMTFVLRANDMQSLCAPNAPPP